MPIKKNQLVLLFKEIQLGNTNAFDELFLRYYDKLVPFALQYTKQLESAEEIVSDLLVKIWINRRDLSNVLSPEVYLFVATKNASLNWIRSNKKRINLFVEPINGVPSERSTSHQNNNAEEKELTRLLNLTVASLPDQRKIIFRLIKEQGLKPKEVAEILGLSIRTVENQLHKALVTLANEISGYLGYNPRAKRRKSNLLESLGSLFFF